MNSAPRKEDRFILWPEVRRRTNLTRGEVNKLVNKGLFPIPIRIGKQSRAWLESAVDQWVAQRSFNADCDLERSKKAILLLLAKRGRDA